MLDKRTMILAALKDPRTKIVATLGPASSDIPVLAGMLRSGMSVARINMSHGTHDEAAARITAYRTAAAQAGKPGAVLVDLCGPKIRTAPLAFGQKPVEVGQGDLVVLVSEGFETARGEIGTTYATLHVDVKPGEPVLIDDGKVRLTAERSTEDGRLHAIVREGGLIGSKKGINLPRSRLSVKALTDKDRLDLAFAARQDADFVALSFVRSAKDIIECKTALEEAGSSALVVAKIEKPEAIADLDAILAASDCVMVARGDLAVEVSIEKVPILQKEIILKANKAGKLVITATQMLESMIEKTIPTRAEATDVANAVIDGTDALMLSGETATGAHPATVVSTMATIAREVEGSRFLREREEILFSDDDDSENMSIAHAAYVAAREYKADAVVVFTETGKTARVLSKFKPALPIIAMTPHDATMRKLALVWGAVPVKLPFAASAEEMIRAGERILVERRILRPGDKVILTAGTVPAAGGTDMLKVHRVGPAGAPR